MFASGPRYLERTAVFRYPKILLYYHKTIPFCNGILKMSFLSEKFKINVENYFFLSLDRTLCLRSQMISKLILAHLSKEWYYCGTNSRRTSPSYFTSFKSGHREFRVHILVHLGDVGLPLNLKTAPVIRH